MYALIQAWNLSDLTRKEFARQNGISVSTLDKWCVRFAKEPATPAQASDSKPEFIELQLPDTGKNKNLTPKESSIFRQQSSRKVDITAKYRQQNLISLKNRQ